MYVCVGVFDYKCVEHILAFYVLPAAPAPPLSAKELILLGLCVCKFYLTISGGPQWNGY